LSSGAFHIHTEGDVRVNVYITEWGSGSAFHSALPFHSHAWFGAGWYFKENTKQEKK
jgi:hypothetical protein